MKVVFPTDNDNGLQSVRSGHFGKAPYYTVVNILENGFQDVECIENSQDRGHSCGGSANTILSTDADALVVGGIGGRPAGILQKAGLDVFIDKSSSTVKEALDLYLNDKLISLNGKGTCDHHH